MESVCGVSSCGVNKGLRSLVKSLSLMLVSVRGSLRSSVDIGSTKQVVAHYFDPTLRMSVSSLGHRFRNSKYMTSQIITYFTLYWFIN
jgi:hypothetical protein